MAGLTRNGGYLWRGLERRIFSKGKGMISTPEQEAQEEGNICPLCLWAIRRTLKIFMVEIFLSDQNEICTKD